MIGEDPMRVEAIGAKLRQAASGSGPGGIFSLALAGGRQTQQVFRNDGERKTLPYLQLERHGNFTRMATWLTVAPRYLRTVMPYRSSLR